MSYSPDERFSIVPEWLLRSGASDRAIRLYAELATFADYESGVARPGRKKLAERMGCSVDTVDRLKIELVNVQAVTVKKRKDGRGNDTNEYVVHRIPPGYRGSRKDAATGPKPPGRTDAAQTREPLDEIFSPSERLASEIVQEAWQSRSSVLISHRESYFKARKTKDAIRIALDVYPAEVIRDAIANYATVLGGAEYRWSYKWTLIDFLKRGLDRFVAEAEPLRNFRANKKSNAGEQQSFEEYGL